MRALNTLRVPAKESEAFDTVSVSEEVHTSQAHSVADLESDLKKVDRQLNKVIEEDEYLSHLFKLITSVEGVGAVTAREVLITTSAFTDFTPSQVKKYARFAGVVPLKHRSGTSVKRRDKISKRANKKIKTTISMGALSVIGTSSNLAQYYHRKRNEGKAHLTVLNAVRNKLILRIFAVVRNNVMYEKTHTYNLKKP